MREKSGRAMHATLCRMGFHVETRARLRDGVATKSCKVCRASWRMTKDTNRWERFEAGADRETVDTSAVGGPANG